MTALEADLSFAFFIGLRGVRLRLQFIGELLRFPCFLPAGDAVALGAGIGISFILRTIHPRHLAHVV